MDTDRPHRSNSSNNSSSSNSGSTSELFICFTSRLSSSSMKISSKSILSPGRARESSQISLSNSLSRRLRSNGSMKGGQASPMFPTNGKKRGCAFENPEPSSPKVTCIGQVRVKTKKQGKKLRTRSQRREGGEVSFRRVDQSNTSNSNDSFEANSSSHQDFNNQFLNQHPQQQDCLPHRNQKWVHLPLTICEALRAFGAEFNCFLPCRSSCMASEKEKEEKAAGSSNGSSCGAVFARWLVAVQEGDGKGREIELVVGEEEEEEEESTGRRRSYRRHVFEEIEFNDEKFVGGNEIVQEEEGRVSICIPPKNALLLMRCRSDPVKMAALANKFWEAPVPNEEEEEGEIDDGNEQQEKDNKVEIEDGQRKVEHEIKDEEDLMGGKNVSCETIEEHQIQENVIVSDSQERSTGIGDEGVQEVNLVLDPEEQTEAQVNQQQDTTLLEETEEDTENLIKNQENEEELLQESEDNQEKEDPEFINEIDGSSLHVSVQPAEEFEEADHEIEDQESKQTQALLGESTVQESKEEEEEEEEEEAAPAETVTHERSDLEDPETREGKMDIKSEERESQPLLPDCLLLMMCEPKLSMEVSKETWVCSTDFIRWLPEHSRPVKRKDGGDQPKKRTSIDINPLPVHNSNLQQPPRSSCSYPAKPPPRAAGAESMTTAIEKKLVGTKAYEPFVLTRCKSEPMRTASKLAAEACFWKNRKLEPHRPATLGVGAAGVGF